MFYNPVTVETYMGLTITSTVVALVAFILLAHLALFHVYINHIGITTYEYVRAARLAQDQADLNGPAGGSQPRQVDHGQANGQRVHREPEQSGGGEGEEEEITEHDKCCQLCSCWTKRRKIAPNQNGHHATRTSKSSRPYTISNSNGNQHSGSSEGQNSKYSSQVTKLPPIHSERQKSNKTTKSVTIDSEMTSSSSVPKLPKLIESSSQSGLSNYNSDSTQKADQLAKVQRHLESVEIENQDKIFVVEV